MKKTSVRISRYSPVKKGKKFQAEEKRERNEEIDYLVEQILNIK